VSVEKLQMSLQEGHALTGAFRNPLGDGHERKAETKGEHPLKVPGPLNEE